MTVLATKLFPPSRRATVVVRPRLAERLNGTVAAGHRLTLVSAPAGFGKSTLLGEWTAVQADGRVRVAWLSIDTGDNVLPRFLTHLAAALGGAGLDLGPDLVETLAGGSGTTLLTAIVNELVRVAAQAPAGHWLLVLDDYHLITAREVHEAVTFFVEHLPDHAHLILATRADPPLPLPRLRSRGELIEIRAADLRFSPAEAREFLNQAMGLDLADSDVAALDERTEGWIVGLQLAALSLRGVTGRRDILRFIEAFTGTHRFVIDYLVDEVLARQDPGVRDFLLRTAVLDRLCSGLCDALTGRRDSGELLHELDRGNVFLIPLDAQRTWYRYHHLFADVLRARLAAERPGDLPRLHRAASRWFSAHDFVAEAVQHALAAGDHADAAHLMEAALPEFRRTRQDAVLLGWMRSLPDSVVRRSPVLSLTSAWAAMMTGELDAMDGWLDAAESALAAGDQQPALAAAWADTEDLRTARATVWLYRAAVAQAHGDVDGIIRHARRVLEVTDAGDSFVRGGATGYLGFAAWLSGDVHGALDTFSEAVSLLQSAGNAVDALDSTLVLGDMWISAGRPRRARRLFEQALAVALRHDPHPRATPDLHVALADLDREEGDLRSAEDHLERAGRLRAGGSITENQHRWYVVSAQVHAAKGDLAIAEDLFDEAEALYRPGFYPTIRPIPAARARMHIAAGDLDKAEEWARGRDLSEETAATFLREYDLLTLVRLRLRRHGGSAGEAGPSLADTLTLLDRLHLAADEGRAGSLLEIGMLRALAHDAQGDRRAALVALDEALAVPPEPDGYTRLFLDEGASMRELLAYALADEAGHQPALLRQHARRLLDAAGQARAPEVVMAAGRDRQAGEEALVVPLSAREREVLRALSSELTGPAIARQLYVSLNTLRTHTRRIFTKLGVNSRAEAVRRGRQLGLL